MVSYGQYCPVAKAAEVLGERWTLLIVRELLNGVEGFNELLRLLPGISRSVLAQRLRTLERRGIVERAEPRGYRLTAAGNDLAGAIDTLGEWGAKWAFGDPVPDELDPDLVMAWIARHTDASKLPETRTVLQVDCRAPKRRYWLVLEPGDVSLCREAPGFDADVLVEADAEQLYGLYFGRTTLRDPAIAVRGAARGEVDSWFAWSPFPARV
jgi:DNA-binding HxlR family transcriptional regulator